MSAIGLPVNILAHFVPRPPIAYERPVLQRHARPTALMSQYVPMFETETPPARDVIESLQEQRKRKIEERRISHEIAIAEAIQEYRPSEDLSLDSDPYKTLFVGRLAYETTERTLRRVFEEWGNVRSVKIIQGKDGTSRGYAFVEFEHERDLKEAYKRADGIKIDSRHILVDVERGRTVPGWLPRRLGGGKGPGREGYHPRQKRRPPNMERRAGDRFQGGSKRSRFPDSTSYRGGDSKFPRDSREGNRRSSFNY